MKRLLFAVVLFLSIPAIVYAQEDTAVETVQGLESYAPWFVALVTGYVGSKFTKILSGISWLGTDSQQELTKLVKMGLGVAIPTLLAIAAMELLPLAEYLDSVGIWPLIGAAVTFAKGTHILDKVTAKINVSST